VVKKNLPRRTALRGTLALFSFFRVFLFPSHPPPPRIALSFSRVFEQFIQQWSCKNTTRGEKERKREGGIALE